jgi:hypothetical protein
MASTSAILNPLDFYLSGHVKALVYAAPVDNEEALHHGIVNACQNIRNCLVNATLRTHYGAIIRHIKVKR